MIDVLPPLHIPYYNNSFLKPCLTIPQKLYIYIYHHECGVHNVYTRLSIHNR